MKIDVSTRVALKAAETFVKLRARLNETIPQGPMKAELTGKEALERLERMTPEERLELEDIMGTDRFLDEIRRLQDGRG